MFILLFSLVVTLCNGRAITVTPANWEQSLQGLQGGDVVTFPGSAASPTVYAHSSALAIALPGAAGSPIQIVAAEKGGAIIQQTSATTPNLQVTSGSFFTIQGLSFQGGSNGISLGSGGLVTDVVTDATLSDLEVTAFSGHGVAANTPNSSPQGLKVNDRLTFSRLHIHHPNGTSNNGLVLGAPLTAGVERVIVQNSVIINCHIHDIAGPAGSRGFGNGVRLLSGSNNNKVLYTVFHNLHIGVRFGDSFDRGNNVANGNAIWNSAISCLETTAGSEVSSNLMFDCTSDGIVVSNLGLKRGTTPRNHLIVYNSVLRASTACFQSIKAGVTSTTVANNVFFCDGTAATNILNVATITWGPNALLGTNVPAGNVPKQLTLGGTTTNSLVLNSGKAGDTTAPWPIQGVTNGLTGRADASFVPSINTDFNCVNHVGAVDVGALFSQGANADPGWAVAPAFRDQSLCPPPPPTTVTTTTTAPATTTTTGTTTTPAGGTTTTPAGGTTTTPAGGTTTTPAGGTTTTPAGGTTTTPAGGTTATTPAGGTTAAAATTAPAGTTAPAPGQPLVPCNTVAFTQGRVFFQANISMSISSFDCNAGVNALAKASSCAVTDLQVHNVVAGSVIFSASLATAAEFQALQNAVRAGTTGLPITCITDANGVQVCQQSGGGVPYWVFIVGAVGAFLLIVLIIVAIIILRKQSKKDKQRKDLYQFQRGEEYQQLRPMEGTATTTYAPSAAAAFYTPPPPARSSGALVTLLVRYAVTDHAPNVLNAKAGDIAFAEEQDWAGTGPWLWVKIGNQEGWVPRSYCTLK